MKAWLIAAAVVALIACAPPQVSKPPPKPPVSTTTSPPTTRPPTTTTSTTSTTVVLPPLQESLVLYGDSLAFEAAQYLDPNKIGLRVAGGTAPRDWFNEMKTDRTAQPAAVAIAFSGNMATACTKAYGQVPLSDNDRGAAYRVMLGDALDIWPGTNVVFIGAPDALPGSIYTYVDEVRQHTEALAAARGVGFADSSAAVAGLPRSDDGLHFCPGPRDRTGACAVNSPAARAYASVIDNALAALAAGAP
jgi:hypothetical protein